MAGALWLTLGSRFEFDAEGIENDLANLVVYSPGSIPVISVIVFIGIGG